jgi:hypothetical protein
MKADKIIWQDGWTKHKTKHSQEKNHLMVQKYMDLAMLDPKAMDERIRQSNLYIIVN